MNEKSCYKKEKTITMKNSKRGVKSIIIFLI